ncbi:MAG: hypothetical protein AAGG57_07060 [Pseudomonadota bacterium]
MAGTAIKGGVEHLPIEDVFTGADAMRTRLGAIRDEDLIILGTAAADLPLMTGGLGITKVVTRFDVKWD